jgi:hypothetical protein
VELSSAINDDSLAQNSLPFYVLVWPHDTKRYRLMRRSLAALKSVDSTDARTDFFLRDGISSCTGDLVM